MKKQCRPLKVDEKVLKEAVNLWLTSDLSRSEVVEKYRQYGMTMRILIYHTDKARGKIYENQKR